MNENPILMTQAQYARHRNKSPQYIGKLYKAGALVMRGRLLDVATDAVLDDKPAERAARDGQQPPTSYAQAKLADMVFRAKLRRLEFETHTVRTRSQDAKRINFNVPLFAISHGHAWRAAAVSARG